MLGVAVEWLGGRYVATAYNNRNLAEWPPHPARLFSALVATMAESDRHVDELAALQWLEQQAAPEVVANGMSDVARRTVAPVFVPVNDVNVVSPPDRSKLDAAREAARSASDAKAQQKAEQLVEKLERKLVDDTVKAVASPTRFGKEDLAAKLLPERRSKQPRTFPSVHPNEPRVIFVWNRAEPSEQIVRGLDALLKRLVRLGHSSSLVRAHLASESEVVALREQTGSFHPDDEAGTLVLRWVAEGQLDRLDRAFALHRETEPRVLPATFVRYREGRLAARTPVPASVFDEDFIVFARVAGPRLDSRAVAAVAAQFRRALMSVAREPLPEILSGHASSGGPSERPHLAVVPLPFVGSEHADGAILGLALVMPRAAGTNERRAVLEAIGRLEEQNAATESEDETPVVNLLLGSLGVLELQRVAWGLPSRVTLRSETWSQPSRFWATATPIALDNNPGDLHDANPTRRARAFEEATASLRKSLERIGLPAPSAIEVVRSCVVAGSAKPRSYPRFPAESNKSPRILVHARLTFDSAVRGPILLGAGRYLGLGLCLPIPEARSMEAAQ